jgi:PPK2 family polyphosphate:nucleotide phosphotransferase
MQRHRIAPGARVELSRVDADLPDAHAGGKDEAQGEIERLKERLRELQELLYAEGRHRLLVVLQAMDTGGKDGAIRHVFGGVNPAGVTVASFKAPSAEELARDYLWRVHPHVPASGQIAIFNRSHYEDVLVVRVKGLVPEERWARRYEQINAFERMLAEEGTTLLKFYLHIDREEQGKRLRARLASPDKLWKFNPQDLAERGRWDEYMRAYEEVLRRTSTDWAPWYLIPANRKWYRNLAISRILVETLERLDMKYPTPLIDPRQVVID